MLFVRITVPVKEMIIIMSYRKVLLVSLSIVIGASIANAEWDWENEKKPQKFFPAIGTEKYKSSPYVMAVGTAEELQEVKARVVVNALIDNKEVRFKYVDIKGDLALNNITEIKQPIYFIHTIFSGEAAFYGVVEALRGGQRIAMDLDHIEERIMQDRSRLAVTFSEKAYFKNVTFLKGALFHGARFRKKVDFSGAMFSITPFSYGDLLGKGASFLAAKFLADTDFRFTKFMGEADFRRVEFKGKVDFSSATFSEAWFTFANFVNKKNEISFKGTQFKESANFSYVTVGKVNFDSFRNETPIYIELNNLETSDLDKEEIPNQIRMAFEVNQLPLSQEVKVSIVAEGNQWLITDEKKKQTYAVFKGRFFGADQLEVYLKERKTWIKTFNLVGCNYKKMDIDQESIGKYDFDESAFSRLIKNQQDIGRPDEAVYLAMKRYQRSQKKIFSRGAELVLFDWTTQYGTAKFPPWGLIAYAVICIFVFSLLYLFNRNFLIFVKTDGTIDETKKSPSILEVFWFSLNTFIPAIELFNARNWQPKYGIKLGGIRFSTLATIERFLGWAMIPSLLGYFRF